MNKSNQNLQLCCWQQGGTLVGFIAGLIVGLSIAVVVALMITKGATPFTNKAAQGKSVPTAGQISDPNKPLYGSKDAAKEAAKDFVKDVETDALGATEAKPLGDKSIAPDIKLDEAKDASKDLVARIDAADEKSIYYLQAGAFRAQNDAENTRAKLALLGIEARVSDRTSDTGTLYRVRVGPFSQVEEMNKIRSKLSENGVDVAVVRNQK